MAMLTIPHLPIARTSLPRPAACAATSTRRSQGTGRLAHRVESESWLGQFKSRCMRANAASPLHELQSAEDLRAQLEALQQEAEEVRGRANGARLRFMRLTHVVEQLRQRAAMDVRMGKEESARLLLTEKQKVMRALEAARQRAELLEQLAGKLNVAISMKETVLIKVLSSAPVSKSEATSDDSAVHHVSPKREEASEAPVRSGVEDHEIGSRVGPNPAPDLNVDVHKDPNVG